jgi:flagellar basal-body rod protein FlgF
MGYGIIETADAMSRMIQKMDYVAQNLANSTTAGFKAEHVYASGQSELPQDQDVPEDYTLPPATTVIDFSRGITQRTGNVLDVMIESDGFFTVQTNNGPAYTRRGDFTLNRDNILVTQTGDPVMGENGPLTINGQKVSIGRDGSIKVDDAEIGKFKIAVFGDLGTLTRGENGYFQSAVEPQKADKQEIAQGVVELSNVNVIREMVDMIDIQRTFEVYQKVIQTMNEEDKIAVTRIGRLV